MLRGVVPHKQSVVCGCQNQSSLYRGEHSHSVDTMVLTAVRGRDASICSAVEVADVLSGASSLDDVDS